MLLILGTLVHQRWVLDAVVAHSRSCIQFILHLGCVGLEIGVVYLLLVFAKERLHLSLFVVYLMRLDRGG